MEDIVYRPFDLQPRVDNVETESDGKRLRLRNAIHDVFEMDGPNADLLMGVCLGVGGFLARKNKAYGNSALSPMRIFSNASLEEQLRVRIDDKLSRLKGGHTAGEDVILDLTGYLVLLLASRAQEGK